MENLDRFCGPDWIPNDDDAVMARVKTTGIVTIEIDHPIENKQNDESDPKFLRFQVVDVGGQRNERKKWIHCFDDVKAILYCDNLAGYNQVLYEDSTKNRMIESLEIFTKLTHNSLFEKTPIFLFLNKRDLFEKMVTEVDMKVTFPEYKGGKDYKNAMDFVQTNFKRQAPSSHEQVYVQVLVASWKREVRVAFEEVKKILYDKNADYLRKEVVKLRNQQKDIIRARIKLLRQQESCCGQVECCGRECYGFCAPCSALPCCHCSMNIFSCLSSTFLPATCCGCCPPAPPKYLQTPTANANASSPSLGPSSPSNAPHNVVVK
jgi:GTPase SAR1 family protein